MDRRERLIAVFEDTQAYYTENRRLADAVQRGKAAVKLYAENEYPELPDAAKAGSVAVTKSKTFEAAMRLRKERSNAKIVVLNFASATNPGGGVKSGSSAQEESLCRCSTLYPTLNQRRLWDQYYLPNREANDPLHSDVCIYSPDVVICKTDESIPQRLPEEQFVTVDVITCAAPNLRQRPGNYHNPDASKAASITRQQLFDLHVKRAKHSMRQRVFWQFALDGLQSLSSFSQQGQLLRLFSFARWTLLQASLHLLHQCVETVSCYIGFY